MIYIMFYEWLLIRVVHTVQRQHFEYSNPPCGATVLVMFPAIRSELYL